MTQQEQQSLAIIDNALASIAANRAQHSELIQATEIVKAAIKQRDEMTEANQETPTP